MPTVSDRAQTATPTRAEHEIREELERWFDDTGNGDVDAIMARFAPEAVSFEQAATKLVGRDAIRQYCQEGFDALTGPFSFEVRDLHITAGEDLAFFHALNHVRSKTKDGKDMDMWARWTGCLRKTRGRWLVVHHHLSNPFDPQTQKVRFDLRP